MVVSVQIAVDHDRIFSALSDATRRDIVCRAIDGEEGVAELAAHYPMSFAAVQKHVAVLERPDESASDDTHAAWHADPQAVTIPHPPSAVRQFP
jgi:hypothetical protein